MIVFMPMIKISGHTWQNGLLLLYLLTSDATLDTVSDAVQTVLTTCESPLKCPTCLSP